MEKLYSQHKQDWELSVAQIMNALFKNSDLNWKNYDLNKICYDYTVEVTNRIKGLDQIECMKNYGWRFMILYR